MHANSHVLAYIGPETMLPVASVLASAIGAILMFWKWIAAFFAGAWRTVLGRKPVPADASETPEVAVSAAPSPLDRKPEAQRADASR